MGLISMACVQFTFGKTSLKIVISFFISHFVICPIMQRNHLNMSPIVYNLCGCDAKNAPPQASTDSSGPGT